MMAHYSTESNCRTITVFFFGEKNSGGMAFFDGGTFNKNLMVLLRTNLVLKDILFKIQI